MIHTYFLCGNCGMVVDKYHTIVSQTECAPTAGLPKELCLMYKGDIK